MFSILPKTQQGLIEAIYQLLDMETIAQNHTYTPWLPATKGKAYFKNEIRESSTDLAGWLRKVRLFFLLKTV